MIAQDDNNIVAHSRPFLSCIKLVLNKSSERSHTIEASAVTKPSSELEFTSSRNRQISDPDIEPPKSGDFGFVDVDRFLGVSYLPLA